MEEKESTVSGSPGISGTESPPGSNLVPHAGNMAPTVSAEVSSFGSTATITPSSTGGGGGAQGGVDLFGKKKRGRPRKYDSDGNLRLAYTGATTPTPTQPPAPPGFSLSPSSPSDFSSKRGRGRPPGSGNWQLLASLGKFLRTVGLVFLW